ncbi:MAG: septation protein IspZ, partial [Pseudomonadota bacterium]
MNAETPSNGSPDSRSNPAGQSPHEQHSDFGKPQQGPDGAATSSENVNSTIAEPNADQSFLKLLVEAGPLLVFFVANTFGQRFFERGDTQLIFWATGLFMAATVISLTASKILFKRLPVMPFVSGVFVL